MPYSIETQNRYLLAEPKTMMFSIISFLVAFVVSSIFAKMIRASKRTPTYPWSIPQASPKPKMKGIPKHKLLVGGLGYAPGVCWKILCQAVFGTKKHSNCLQVGANCWRLRNSGGISDGDQNPRDQRPKPLLFAVYKRLHPGRLTWNIIMEVWKMIFLSKWVIFRFHVNLPGCIRPS